MWKRMFYNVPYFSFKKGGGGGTKYKKNVGTILYVILDVVHDSSLMLNMWNVSEKVMILVGSLLTQDTVWFLVWYRKLKRKLWRAECFCSWHQLLSKKIITTLKTNREREFKHVVPDMNHRKNKSMYLCKKKSQRNIK